MSGSQVRSSIGILKPYLLRHLGRSSARVANGDSVKPKTSDKKERESPRVARSEPEFGLAEMFMKKARRTSPTATLREKKQYPWLLVKEEIQEISIFLFSKELIFLIFM